VPDSGQDPCEVSDLVFDQIAAEMPQRRYAPPEFSLRQLRRIVYG
jgi:hypothetical protein